MQKNSIEQLVVRGAQLISHFAAQNDSFPFREALGKTRNFATLPKPSLKGKGDREAVDESSPVSNSTQTVVAQ